MDGVPRRFQSKADNELADRVIDYWYEQDRMRRPRVTAWNHSYKAHDPQYIDRTKVTRAPFVKMPYLHRVTGTQVTILLEATDANGLWLDAQPMTRGDDLRERHEAVTQFLENTKRHKGADLNSNNEDAIDRLASFGGKYGNAYLQPQWVERPDYTGLEFHTLSPYDVWPDARWGRFYLVERTLALSQLRDLAKGISAPNTTTEVDPSTGETLEMELPPRDGGRALRVFRRLERMIREGRVQSSLARRFYDDNSDQDRRFDIGRIEGEPKHEYDRYIDWSKDPFNAPVRILEFHETHAQGIVARVIPGFSNDGQNLVLQAEPNPYGACSIVPYTPHRVDNEYYGLGNGEICGLLVEGLDYNFRASLAAIAAQGWPPVLKTRGATLKRNFNQALYGLTIDVRQPTDLQYMQPSIGPAFHQIGQQIIQSAMDFATGDNEMRRGNGGTSNSATAASIAESFSSITDKQVFRQWKRSMEQVGHVAIAMARIHMTRSRMLPVLGRQTMSFMEIRPEFLEGPFQVRFGGNPRGSNSVQQISQISNMAQTFGVSGVADLREMLREVDRLGGSFNPDRFLAQRDTSPPMPAEAEHEMLFLNGAIGPPSPRDDHFDHLQKHAPLLQSMQQRLPLEDPRIARLLLHMQAHQQLAAPQGAAQGGGVSPFRPEQAGQPGQPASFQPAVAGINEARQASNGAAAGGAPGPGGVPNRMAASAGGGA